ncbi:hypothetical protein [Nitrincola tapanii]|uniref:hypothetical protein n=1 Tax=Nitrincola tapanii TaxID=1708751 RepID=UPI00190F63A8|nr:hypothetical protein [Nitrincola tapanii]
MSSKKRVLIIESASPADFYEGRSEADSLHRILEIENIKSRVFNTLDIDHFIKALSYADKKYIHYVHISAHGNADGFELTDGTFIDWKTFDEIAWPYLKNCCICFSSCDVAQGAAEVFKYHKTFCNAIVGPTRKITWGEGLVAFSAFYHRALTDHTSTASDVRVMNHIAGKGTFKLIESEARSTTYTLSD